MPSRPRKSRVLLEYWHDAGRYVGRLREVPGVFSQGATLAELEENFRHAYRTLRGEEPAIEATPAEGKNPVAAAFARLGGLKGGPARTAKLTAEQRSESARKAALARWGRQPAE